MPPHLGGHDACPHNGHNAADDVPDSFLWCRSVNHAWTPWDVHVTRVDIQQSLRCANCGTVRHITLSRQGFILGSRYEYVEGYTRPGAGRLSVEDRAAFRVANTNYILKEKKR